MFDLDLLRTFAAVSDQQGFSTAGRMLGISQPTVTQRVLRLEKQVGKQLLLRNTHTVSLTEEGQEMLVYVRQILSIADQASAHFAAPALSGRIRFGTADDLALTHLPGIVREFRRAYPHLTVDISVGQSAGLTRQLKSGRLDLIYVRLDDDSGTGRLVRCEQLVWAAHRSLVLEPDQPIPLVTYQPGSASRAAAVSAIEASGRAWRVTCSARDVTGILAGVRAAVGVAVFPLSMMPADLGVVSPNAGLPPLGTVDFALVDNPASPRGPVDALSQTIIRLALG